MSNLSDLLSRILKELEKSSPAYVNDYYQGISRQDVEAVLEGLACRQLPSDLYALYQWRNGNPDYFPGSLRYKHACDCSAFAHGYEHNPIEVVAKNMEWEWCSDSPPLYEDRQLLPFIELDCEFVAVAMASDSEKAFYDSHPHIVCGDEFGNPFLYCDSITSMLTSVAECFDARAIWIDEEGYFREDCKQSAAIWRTHNPLTLSVSLSRLMRNLTICCQMSLEQEPKWEGSLSKGVDEMCQDMRTMRTYRPLELIDKLRETSSAILSNKVEKLYGLENSLREWMTQCSGDDSA